MAVLGRGEEALAVAAGGDDAIDRAEEHLERVRETFDVPGRIVHEARGAVAERRRGAEGGFVRAVAVAEAQLFRFFRAPL